MRPTVLLTADTVGGVWTYALQLSAALGGAGVDVHLATMGAPPSAAQRRQAAAVPIAGLHPSAFRLEWMEDPWDDVTAAGHWLLHLRDRVAPDVVHLNGYAHGALDWQLPTVVAGHSCVWSWWWAVHHRLPPPAWDRYRRVVTDGLQAASAVVAPTAFMLESLRRFYGIFGGTVVPNGRDDSWVRPAAKEPLVLGAGRLWDEAKNLPALTAAAPAMPWPVVVAGPTAAPDSRAGGCDRDHRAGADRDNPGDRRRGRDGDHREPAPRRPESDELAGRGARRAARLPESDELAGRGARRAARLLGPLAFDELAGWLQRAAVFAAPARYEPFGLAALEAAQAGCALVLGDLPSFREVWDDAALYVDPEQPDALADAVRRLTADERLRRRLQQAARRQAGRYRATAMADAMLDVYRAVSPGRFDTADRAGVPR